LIAYSPEALRQIIELRDHYRTLDRIEAIRALDAALSQAERRIAADPAAGLPAPRPYPQLASPGRSWLKAGRYWIAYRTLPRLTIAAVFYDTANIPSRLPPP
jgi:plasmid stabilization system protein ParE